MSKYSVHNNELLGDIMSQERVYNEIVQQALTQGGFAAAVGPFAVTLQNVIIHLSLHPDHKYPQAIKVVFTKKDGIFPAFKGIKEFSTRMAVASAMGYTGTDQVANKFLNSLPTGLQPVLGGLIMGLAEAVVTGKAERAELMAMTNGNISYGQVIKGSSIRNAFGWTAGEYAMRLCNENSCSQTETMGLGFIAGAIAGLTSMQLQKALAMTASNQKKFSTNVQDILRLGLPAFRGGGVRAGILALYTAAAALANLQIKGAPGGKEIGGNYGR